MQGPPPFNPPVKPAVAGGTSRVGRFADACFGLFLGSLIGAAAGFLFAHFTADVPPPAVVSKAATSSDSPDYSKVIDDIEGRVARLERLPEALTDYFPGFFAVTLSHVDAKYDPGGPIRVPEPQEFSSHFKSWKTSEERAAERTQKRKLRGLE